MIVTNRELLRNYKNLKARLLRGQVKKIRIKQEKGVTLILHLERKPKPKAKTAFEKMVDMIEEHPLQVKRPEADLFDYL